LFAGIFYQSDTYCPIPAVVFQVLACVSLILNAWFSTVALVNMYLQWKHEHAFTPVFRTALFLVLWILLTLSALTTRAFYPDTVVVKHWSGLHYATFARICHALCLGHRPRARSIVGPSCVSIEMHVKCICFRGLSCSHHFGRRSFAKYPTIYHQGKYVGQFRFVGVVCVAPLVVGLLEVRAAIKMLPEETPASFRAGLGVLRKVLPLFY
jgi:hypothetical protein